MYLKDIEKIVKEIITELLDNPDDALNLDASFLELGINSVLAVELVEAINQKLGIELGVEVMFDYRDIRELTHFIFQHYGKEDLSKELPPPTDNIRFPGEGTIRGDSKTYLPAIEAESDDSHKERRDRKEAVGTELAPVRFPTSPCPEIAIIGISGIFANSPNVEAFWQHLQAGESCIEEIRRHGWETSAYYNPDPERMNTSISKWGGMLQDVDKFDPFFFNISPREAARMDPQQRLFLQEAYRAFEDAGYSAEQLSDKKVGVFVGARSGDYKEKVLRRDSALRLSEEIDSHLFLGNDMAILAARISYFLNCKGPSLTIDTACSSSLVAIHLACESIRTGEADMALAGGVFVLSSPEFYVMTSKTQMLSPDGKCKTFDNTANGIVIGEGVGAVILKPLEAALKDGDHIYGVILGSGMNQDGRTKGITAPSMLSQKALLSDIYKKTAIHPETVSYIEAHGTGTKLGDPIEIKALTEAFRLFTDKTQFCAIGSHKPNIGHTIMTAGIAGVFKVLMAMKYQQIPPTINLEEVNQHIDFQSSPFFINTELREWKSRDSSPRRAGVSSFGFSGTNCHIILEEPPQQKKAQEQSKPYTFFPFSAKTKAALAQKVADLVKWLEKEGETYALEDISYTLVHGRSHFAVRTAVVARDTNDLLHTLREIMSKGSPEHNVENEKGDSSEQTEPLLQQYGHWLLKELLENASLAEKDYKEKLAALADLYIKGYNLDWGKLFKKGRCHRVPLPTYPFIGASYWLVETSRDQSHIETQTGAVGTGASPVPTAPVRTPQAPDHVPTTPYLHPLVQRNTSTLWEQQFTSTFHGDEFFLTDHAISEQQVMPGVAYLEMAYAAVREAIGTNTLDELSLLHLSQVVWVRPLTCDSAHPVTVNITLSPVESGSISFLISRDDVGAVPSLLCQGTALVGPVGVPTRKPQTIIPNVDLLTALARCQHQISATECYQYYRSLGMSYGPALQGIEQLSIGEGEVLARLRLPEVIAQSLRGKSAGYDFVLHPSVLDAALQAGIILYIDQNKHHEPLVPFALDKLEVMGQVPTECWAWVRLRSHSATGQERGQASYLLDIDVCDDAGSIAVSMQGLNIRQLPTHAEETRTVLLTPRWKEEAIPPLSSEHPASIPTIETRRGSGSSLPTYAYQLVLLCDLPYINSSHIQDQMTSSEHCQELKVKHWHSSHLHREQRFQDATVQLIQELQHLLLSRLEGPVLVQVVVAHTEEPSFLEALTGVLKTAKQEYPKLRGQLIEVEGKPEEKELLARLYENQLRPQESHIRYQDGKRWVQEWQECAKATAPANIPWKEGGCYLISGGAGGLARIFVQEIARQVQTATVILVGRSALSREQHEQLEQTGGQGIRINYQQVDVARVPRATGEPTVHALIRRVLMQYGHLDGIIHAAGVLRDSLLLNKTQEEVQAVLAPKISGVESLDEGSREIPLDFFILCSSLTAVVGNVGQADYAAANAYLDAFAHARAAKVSAGQRQGATLSINWPYWETGGMQIEAETAQMMREQLGIEAMGTETGIRTLYQALASGLAQVIVLHGQVERIKQRLLRRLPEPPVEATPEIDRTSWSATEEEQQVVTTMGQEESGASPLLQERASTYFKKQLAAVIKLPVQQIDVSASLENYGFDSIMAIRFTNALEDSFGPLSKTLVFEYPTLQSVTEYFLHNYSERLRRVLRIEEAGGKSRAAIPQIIQEGDSTRLSSAQKTAPFPVELALDHRLQASHSHHRLALLRKEAVGTGPDRDHRDSGLPLSYPPQGSSHSPLPPVSFPTDDVPVADGYAQQDKETRVGDIAIIGMAGRYAGARDLRAFWENLRDGRDCITEIPPERWDHRLYFDADKNKHGTTYCKWGGFLEGVDEFDPLFFNISPREAQIMDPQERLFLECAFATLEDAGYTPWDKPRSYGMYQDDVLAGNVGVFVGVMYEEYQLFGAQEQIQGRPVTVAGSPSWIANRVSYFCNFHGPSLAVDTMCSSSLTAIHLACQSIQHGDCKLAIAGGVNVSLHPNKYLFLAQGKFVSSQGHCESFGLGADGYVPSEGVGAVLLKPLAQAEADGDHIYGVIKATAINHGGKTNGPTVPNPHAQAEVIGQALKKARIDPRTISYIEAHGTGTVLGDPIEIAGLTRAFVAPGRTQDNVASGWCAIGSVKSNIGHAESAAGIAGLTKVLLQMRYGQLVPSLHAEVLNPHIDFSTTPFVVQQELTEWKRPLMPGASEGQEILRRAGISSFGAGGSNAHVILEEYVGRHQGNEDVKNVGAGSEPHTIPTAPSQRSRPALVVLSARTEEQLHALVQQLLDWMQEKTSQEPQGLQELAYTLQVGRQAMEERLALQVSSLVELEEKLHRYVKGEDEGDDWYRGQVKGHDAISVFTADEDGQNAIAAWMSKGKYEKLLELWVKGGTINWKHLYGEHLPLRISLPTYPFARERYWLPKTIFERKAGQAAPLRQGSSEVGTSECQSVSFAQDGMVMPIASRAEAVGTLRDTDRGLPLSACACPAPTNRIALRPLADHPVLSRRGRDDRKEPSLQSLPASLKGADQPQPLAIGANTPAAQGTQATAEAQPGTDEPPIIVGASPAPTSVLPAVDPGGYVAQDTIPTVSGLEGELVRSLAQALYMEENDIDVETPFVEMGLDSVVGLEWIQSLNKQYAINLAVGRVYDHPTVRRMAGLLEKDLLKQRGEIQQTPVQSPSDLSQDDPLSLLQRLQLAGPGAAQGTIPTEQTDPGLAPEADPASEEHLQARESGAVGTGTGAVGTGLTPVPTALHEKEAIAIVGMSGKYPDANNLSEYWDNLVQGKNAIHEIPLSRFDVSDYYDPNPAAFGKISCKWLGALADIEYFDPLFFHLSPAEAEGMDPHQRLFLEEGYKAFEDAGYSPELLSDRKCGVYLGVISHEYSQLLYQYKASETNVLGTSFAIAAARIAYLLNLKGPAIAIDTACSSSLVATHLACQALWNQEVDMALVGGVSLYLTPGFYAGLCTAGMLSPDGQCKTFDSSANGFVPGEGVGALVLKRLADAEADHDQIYGVIVASGINQDGATNGITAPSVKSQIELEREVYEKYDINPESISYVEMHGTGTKLGDPIELEALATVFCEKTQRKQYCAIGSVKSNIGHTSAAAGVASVQKVLLAMKQKKLVPTLHFKQPNEHFDFAASPFYVNTEVQDWKSATGNPLRAAVSSFGYSGTNAHLVLEEYIPAREADRDCRDRTCLFVLSAKSEQQLTTYAQDMKRWIQAHEELALRDIAFTLQVGRQAMDYRLAIVTDSREVLLRRLEEFVDKHTSTSVHIGQVKKGINDARLFEEDRDAESLLQIWCQKNLEKIAQLWVKGVNVDWKLLYTVGAGQARRDSALCLSGPHHVPTTPALPHRISLPTYPFLRERYWIPTPLRGSCPLPTESLTVTTVSSLAPLHPLVQCNISNFFEQRFRSTFCGDEFFLADHVVKGQHIMPGVAYLEMAHVAVAQATRIPGATEERRILPVGQAHRLRHVVWVRPLAVGEHPITVHITLKPQENGTIAFHISGDGAGQLSGKEIAGRGLAPSLLSQGTAELCAESTIASQSLDVPAIQARCPHQVSATECYQRYRELGIDYGPTLRGIEQLSIGEDEVLARLRLPVAPGAAQTYTEGDRREVGGDKPSPLPYVLHPSMLDAALQACIGLLIEEHQKPQLPFALDELEIVGMMPAQGWAWVRRRQRGATELTVDIEVCDDEGRIAVRLRGLSSRVLLSADTLPTGQDAGVSAPMATKQSTPLVGTQEGDKLLSYIPRWDPVVLSQPAEAPELTPDDPTNQVVIVGGTPDEQSTIARLYPHAYVFEIPTSTSIESLAQWLQELVVVACRPDRGRVGLTPVRPYPSQGIGPLHVFWLAPHDPQLSLTQESILAAQQQGVLACFRLIKALLQLGYGSRTLRWTVITRQIRVLHATETGHPTHASLLGLFGSLTKEYSHWSIQQVDLLADVPLPLTEILRLPADPQGHGWSYRNGHWYRPTLVPLDVSSFETHEAYRRGGVYVVIGGAGGIGEVWSKYLIRRYQAQIIWIGRRKSDAEIVAKQERLAALGPRPHYITTDASNRSALQQAYQEIKQNFGQIHGVVHSAIVLLDQSLANMDEERFQEALTAKVDVSVRLAQVFEQEPLDFVLFFSSLNAFTCNAGQSNYAAGCTFEDTFAARLRRDWRCRVKVMNWGYWGSIGVVASQEYRERVAQTGLGSIEPAEAMEALEHLLAGPVDQMVLLKTTKPMVTVRMPVAQGTPVAQDTGSTQATIPTVPGREMIQAEEMITVYPERLPSYIHSLDHYRLPQLKPTQHQSQSVSL